MKVFQYFISVLHFFKEEKNDFVNQNFDFFALYQEITVINEKKRFKKLFKIKIIMNKNPDYSP